MENVRNIKSRLETLTCDTAAFFNFCFVRMSFSLRNSVLQNVLEI